MPDDFDVEKLASLDLKSGRASAWVGQDLYVLVPKHASGMLDDPSAMSCWQRRWASASAVREERTALYARPGPRGGEARPRRRSRSLTPTTVEQVADIFWRRRDAQKSLLLSGYCRD